MIERIKRFWATAGDVLAYILVPLVFLMGFLAYLLGDRDKWKAKFRRQETAEKIKDIIKEKEDAKKTADDLERDFRVALDQYNKSGGGGPTNL